MQLNAMNHEDDKQTLDSDSVTALVHNFYTDVRADSVLAPVFDEAIGAHWPEHLERMVQFWSAVALGEHGFKGDVFGKHMALDGVTPEHFTLWLGLWKKHTEALFHPEIARALQYMAHNIARNLFRGFFGHFPQGNLAADPAAASAG